MQPKGSFPCSEDSLSSPCPPFIFRRSILILYSHLSLGLQSVLFTSGFSTKSLYQPLRFPHRSADQNQWARDFLDSSRPTLGSTHPIQWERGSFPGVKWPGREADQSPRSSAEVKTRLVLYNYFPCMLSRRRQQQLFPTIFLQFAIIFQLFWSSYIHFIHFIVNLMHCNIKICKTCARGWYSIPKHVARISVLFNRYTRH
jgi:hypothetical protein